MASKKLNTEHLAQQLEAILNEEGISPEKLAISSGIAKSTIYAILNRDRPSTQREVARKIAKATGREFEIEGDRIIYTKPTDPVHSDAIPESDQDILQRLGAVLRNYSADDKSTLINLDLESSFGGLIDILLANRSNLRSAVTSEHSSGELAEIEQQFCAIWDRTDESREKKVKQTYDLLKGTNLPKLIYTSAILEVNILNPEGDANIKRTFHTLNTGDETVLGESRFFYFEENQKEDVRLVGKSDQDEPLQLEMMRNYENYKEFFCRFGKPLKLGEAIAYEYEFSPKRMFTSAHYWDWHCRNLTLNSKIVIRHNKGKKFKGCTIKRESEQGLQLVEDPNLQIKSDDTSVEITWLKYYPRFNHKYRIFWEFYE